jgi:hypothetical protein
MNSLAGSGEYSNTSTSPSDAASDLMALVNPSLSRMSAAATSTVSPSPCSSPANASNFSASRATSPTPIPSLPNRRATAAPRLGPAPTITIDMPRAFPGACRVTRAPPSAA